MIGNNNFEGQIYIDEHFCKFMCNPEIITSSYELILPRDKVNSINSHVDSTQSISIKPNPNIVNFDPVMDSNLVIIQDPLLSDSLPEYKGKENSISKDSAKSNTAKLPAYLKSLPLTI